jgi:hypothetical protein
MIEVSPEPKQDCRKIMKLAAALIAAATFAGTAAASAQSVQFQVGPNQNRGYTDHYGRDWRDSRAQYRDYRDRDGMMIRRDRFYRDRDGDYRRSRPGVTLRY